MDRLTSLINGFKEKHDIGYNEIPPGSDSDSDVATEKSSIQGDDDSLKNMPGWRPSRLQCVISMTVIFIVLVFGIIFAATKNSSSSPVIFSADLVPQGNPVVRTFEDSVVFGGLPTSRTNDAWDALLPAGGGLIPVSDPETYGLPSDDSQETQLWDISVFNQLECLILLRKVHYNFVRGTPSDPTTVHRSERCFDYLRQAISCYGDTTLEAPLLRSDDSLDQTTFNSPRQCRDFSSIKEYAETAYNNFVQ